ncbi:MAG: hypothetical protein LPH21_00810, partial [Shewanella sp.]|nr:hypothetical protein [Shewanella sp.]
MRRTTRVNALLTAAEKMGVNTDSKLFFPLYQHAVEEALTGNKEFLRFIQYLEQIPVDIETFLDSPEFLGATDLKLWPEVRKSIIELNRFWWKGLDHGAHKEAILAGATGCVSADTEYLTPTGWKRIDQYVEGERVFQYNEDGSAEFVHPREYIKLPCDNFLHFHAAGAIDQLLSREHHIVFFNDKREIDFITADQAAQVHNTKGFRGKFRTTFDYPKSTNTRTSSLAALYILTKHRDCVSLGRQRYRYHAVDEDRVSITRWLCDKAKVAYRVEPAPKGYYVYFNDRALRHYNLYDRLSFAPEIVLFVEPLITEQRKSGGIYYNVTDATVADFIQTGLAISGERSTIVPVEDGSWQITADLEDYVTLRSKSSARTYEPAMDVPSQDGFKYCFSVDSSMLVLRRH